jgi:hypothetical protein
MNFEQAIKIVKKRYGLLTSYLDARTGKIMTVVKAENELRAIPEVPWPEWGISLFHTDIIELADERITVENLVRRKNPELFEAGRMGGTETAKRGPEYFRRLQSKRKVRAGGRPPKEGAEE